MKVYVFPDGDPRDPRNFVAPIRLLDPLRALSARYGLRFLCHAPGRESELADAGLVIVQRACFGSRRALDRGLTLLSRAQRAGARIVYELDDHLFCPGLTELIADSAIDEIDPEAYELTQAHREILGLADYLTCPTEPLAEALGGLGSGARVRVIPTKLDFRLARWRSRSPARREAGNRFRIGWSGGSRVGRDLEIMIPALVEITRAHPDVIVVLAGALKYAPLLAEIPAGRLHLLEWVEYDRYPALLATFDLALVPMQDHAYNRCKSALKVIDYGAAGVPSICSPVAPYTDFPGLGGTPLLAEDGEWAARIGEFLQDGADDDTSAQLAARTRQLHGLHENLPDYWSALNEMLAAEESIR